MQLDDEPLDISNLKSMSRLLKKKHSNDDVLHIENRIYREKLKESLGMNFFSPLKPEREFKVYKSCKCLQIICSSVH